MRAVISQEGEWWVGQCIEQDIAAQSKTFEGAIKELKDMIEAYEELYASENAAGPPATPQDVIDKLRQRAGAQEVDLG